MPNFINLPPPYRRCRRACRRGNAPREQSQICIRPKLETFFLSKSLLTGLTYPHDWGFVPSTKADDGDPIDIMVIHDAATFPGMVLTCRIIGILQIEQKSKGNGWAERPPVRSTPALALGAGPARCSGHLKADFRKSLRSSSSQPTSLKTNHWRSSGEKAPRSRSRR